MFFYHREPNSIAESHKDPIGAVFFLGGVGGCLAVAHYVFFIVQEIDSLKIIEWLVSGWWYTGVLSIGFFRSLQYVLKKNNSFNTFPNRIQFIFLIILMITFISSCAGIIGAVPLAFIDFMGGGLVGMKGRLGDFYNTLGIALLIGVCVGVSFSFLICIGIIGKLISRKWFLLSASVGGGIIGSSIVFLLRGDAFMQYLPAYGTLYGLLLGLSVILYGMKRELRIT